MNPEIDRLVAVVEKASPMLWAAAQHKVTSLLFAQCVWIVFWLLLLGLSIGLAKKKFPEYDNNADFVHTGGWIGGILSSCAIVVCLGEIGCILLARDWYAIKALADLSPLK